MNESDTALQGGDRRWLTTEALAERLQTHPGTCRYWRHIGYGPAGVKVGRRVLYLLSEVQRWEQEQIDAQRPAHGEPA